MYISNGLKPGEHILSKLSFFGELAFSFKNLFSGLMETGYHGGFL